MLTIKFIEEHISSIKSVIRNANNVENVQFNSQSIEENGMFFAFTQGQRDGHHFIASAIENGATTIVLSNPSFISLDDDANYFLVEDAYHSMWELAKSHRESLKMPIISITGSNGKTTTKDILFQILSKSNKVFKTPKNLNNHIGVPLNLLNVDNSFDYVILELGMNHKGEIDALASLVQPYISIITNIGESHIEFLGSTENIAKAKAEIIPHTSNNGFVVMNQSIKHRDILTTIEPSKTIRFVDIENKNSNLYADNIQSDTNGYSFSVEGHTLFIPLKGLHNVQNTLLAIYVAKHFQFDIETIKSSLKSIEVTGMRYEYIPSKNKAVMINDAYNASPSSVKASVETFMNEPNKKIIVLGDIFELGELSKPLHEEIGRFLNQYANQIEMLITIGNDSRYIHDEYKGNKRHFVSQDDVAEILKPVLNEEAYILFKASRGMHLESIVEACL